jgi:acyl-CoA thioesterase I
MASLTNEFPEMSFMLTGRGRSYGFWLRLAQIAICCLVSAAPAEAQQIGIPYGPYQVVALGDSLTAGYGLAVQDGFVPRLQAALAAAGLKTNLQNAGVSGDTVSDGLARLDWSVPDGTQAVILELGANDMLRGIKPELTRQALDEILRRLTARRIVVLLCGMRAAPNLGPEYGRAFDSIYPDLAEKYHVPLYPFFLDGVAGDLSVLQQDGLHPSAEGVKIIVARIVPQVRELLAHTLIERPM